MREARRRERQHEDDGAAHECIYPRRRRLDNRDGKAYSADVRSHRIAPFALATRAFVSFVFVILAAVAVASVAVAATPPWKRTETREPCGNSVDLRQPFFGELHVHTRWSADAYIFGTRVGPRDAYAFARGGTIPVVDDLEVESRTATIERPLDFAAVTDHAELFGEVDLCATPGSPVFDVMLCQMLREVETTPDEDTNTTIAWLAPLGIPNPPTGLAFCDTPGVDCNAHAVSVWQDIQAAAEEAYDRTSACGFTSFIGYEYTPSLLGAHLHRNVIFRNEHVPSIALSYLDTLDEPGAPAAEKSVPRGLWTAIENQCLGAASGCDAVIIPHNSNLSAGMQFFDPTDGADALRRQTIEPLVEIHQIKGNSECRFDRLAGAGVGTTDELCTFEQQLTNEQGPFAQDLPVDKYPRRNLVRETLEDGLGFEQTLGANPFRFGFVGGTDSHDGTAGNVAERSWIGGQGRNDGSDKSLIRDNLRTNPGGLTVAWAEENSRDAVFSALRRRETYATSGTRPVVRFFGGTLDDVKCGDANLVQHAYERGTPMGGELGPVRGKASPRFVVWAMKDAGTASSPGADLQRIQIVKGWVDDKGATQERVVDVVGDAQNGASVDPATCEPTGTGSSELCTVWEDPDFNPGERAFYYARVLENPVCRWSTRICKQEGVDPFASDCAAQAAAADPAFADCCLAGSGDRFLSPTVQERAWTSPIWYRPEAVGRLRARIAFGKRTGHDALALRATLGAVPATLDLAKDGLTVRLRDDDDIIVVAVPAGGFRQHGKRYTFKDRSAGTRTLSVVVRKHDVQIALAGRGVDLSSAARDDHDVTLSIESGLFRSTHTRRWQLHGARLAPEA